MIKVAIVVFYYKLARISKPVECFSDGLDGQVMQARDSEKACGHFKHCKKSFRNCLCRLVKLSVSSLNLSVGKHLNKSFFFF